MKKSSKQTPTPLSGTHEPQTLLKPVPKEKIEKALKEAFKQYPRTIKALANR
jgi:hypothetical protein